MHTTDTGRRPSPPAVIDAYLAAHDVHDTDATLATFTPTAVVIDDGRTATGHDEIRRWLERTASEFTYERALLDATPTDADTWLVRSRITGNFPGGTVDLGYRFTVRDGLIAELTIAPTVS